MDDSESGKFQQAEHFSQSPYRRCLLGLHARCISTSTALCEYIVESAAQ